MSTPAPAIAPDRDDDTPRLLTVPVSRPDRVFRSLTTAGAMASLVVMALIAVFLFAEAWPAMRKAGWGFFTRFEWRPDEDPAIYGIASAVYGTVVMAAIALVIAVPISVGTALFIHEYAPRRVQRLLVSLVDLLAAVPSLIFGLWGKQFLEPKLNGLAEFLSSWFGWIPIFKSKFPIFGSSLFVSGIVLALMIVPIVTSVSRAVLAEVPRPYCEAALALGGTRAGMIKEVVLPFGRGGLIGASMLGLGRALGETIAVALILSIDYTSPTQLLNPGGASVAGMIAVRFGEASTNGRSALVGAGLVLFVLTLLVNLFARLAVARVRPPRGASKS